MTNLQAALARSVAVGLAVYLTWWHVQFWHVGEHAELLAENGLALPWLASLMLFQPLAAVLVALAWIVVVLLPSTHSAPGRAVTVAGIGFLVAALAAGGLSAQSTFAATFRYAKGAQEAAVEARDHASGAEDAARDAASSCESP